jgi:histidinol-phosphate/aromatic aminotransferase/cobyric acid decarboxylase-like protein
VEALADLEYYAARYVETHQLRAELEAGLRGVGLKTFPGVGNFVLCELPAGGLECADAATLVARCRERGVFIRDASGMGRGLGGGAGYVRIAVKDARGNARVVEGVSVIRVEVQSPVML